MYPNLKIPVSEGAYTEAYWVTPVHDGYIQAVAAPSQPQVVLVGAQHLCAL